MKYSRYCALKIQEPEVDLGRFRSSAQMERIIWLRNTGKRDLVIRSLQVSLCYGIHGAHGH